ncbi:MAG: hypothetical protein WKG07_24665 [Hymenobacter sp.]
MRRLLALLLPLVLNTARAQAPPPLPPDPAPDARHSPGPVSLGWWRARRWFMR